MVETLLTRIGEAIDREGFVSDVEESVQILHIEDNAEFAELVATYLQRKREYFEISTETDPRQALDRLSTLDVDCIVCDYDMPGLNGLEVLHEVRDEWPELPFILFTGKGSEEIASEAISSGVTEYLQKAGGTDQYEVLANRIEQAVARRRAERQVMRGFQAIETAYDGISLLDEDGRFIYVNEAYTNITGYDRTELIGAHWDILYRDTDLEAVHEEVLPQAREGGWTGRTVYVRADGEEVPVEHRLAYTDDGTLICTISELTEADEMEAALSLRERAMDKAPIGITITDPERADNPIIYANDGFLELTGYPREEVLGRNCRFLQGEKTSEESVARMREAIDSADPVTVELWNYRNDGEPFWNRVSIAPLFDDEGRLDYFVGFQEELTEEYLLQQEHERRAELTRELGQVLSHDLGTPLEVLRGRIELAQETGELSNLDDAMDAVERIDELTETLAAVMRTGELVGERESVDVGRLASDVWDSLETGAASLAVPDEGPTVSADETALRRALENLLENALVHGPEDVAVRVGVLGSENGFYVEDDGPGIPDGQHETVFEPGYTTRTEGTGLGLVSVSQVISAHGWDIRAVNGNDGGARFEITGLERTSGVEEE